MPALIPQPRYGPDTPEVHDFYERLKAGLGLTLDGELALRANFLVQAVAAQPDVHDATEALQAAIAAAEEARAALAALKANPPPRIGLRALQAGARTAEEALGEAERMLSEGQVRQGHAQREAQLRDGSTRPRVQWQLGSRKVGPAPYGVYAFYDYDGRAMYVGKTTEGVSVRVRRHLTNQRTDAVGMSVLDPLEVVEVEVWPLWPGDDAAAAKAYIDGLEYAVEQECTAGGSTLFNEKRIVPVDDPPALPASVRFDVLSAEHRARLGHPDLRIARRLAVSARLGSRIVERSLRNVGLRRSLQRQLARLQELADARFAALGGEAAVPVDEGDDDDD